MNARSERQRLDQILVARGLYESREKARGVIMAGLVSVDGKTVDKPGTRLKEDVCIAVKEVGPLYVSRGGFKLEHALNAFEIDPAGMVTLDVGASTGGFTDCLLQRGAAKVWAVDVGYGQIHQKLRDDPRVILLERTNARYLNAELVPDPIDLAVMDVSFISITKIVPALLPLFKQSGILLSLVKPQFEAGRSRVKRGVVRDPDTHKEVLTRIVVALQTEGLAVLGLTFSPIKGPSGNIEFFVCAKKRAGFVTDLAPDGAAVRAVGEAKAWFEGRKDGF